MTSVLVRNNKVVKTIARERPLRSDESANGGRRLQVVDGVEIFIGGTVTITNGKVSAITNPAPLTTAQLRRLQVKRWLRMSLDEPFWSIGTLLSPTETLRTSHTAYWIRMIAKASAKDSNLTTDSRFRLMVTEMDFKPGEWWSYHNVANWASPILTDRYTLSVFYSTITIEGATKGNLLERTAMDMTASSTEFGNIVQYLES